MYTTKLRTQIVLARKIVDMMIEYIRSNQKKLNILVACEESQTATIIARELGQNAFSCDIQPCSGGHPEAHILGDVTKVLNGGLFRTQDGKVHRVDHWDLIIAHPPCTFLTRCGATHMYPHGQLNKERYKKGLEALKFFMLFLKCKCPHIVVENPVPLRIFGLPVPSQKIHPFMFGNPYTKETCLWNVDLPTLIPTNIVDPIGSWVALHKTAKQRSKSFHGIAEAMIIQYVYYILKGESAWDLLAVG